MRIFRLFLGQLFEWGGAGVLQSGKVYTVYICIYNLYIVVPKAGHTPQLRLMMKAGRTLYPFSPLVRGRGGEGWRRGGL